MKNRKILIILLITLGLLFITTGTVSYYRYSINGKINATAGNYTFNVSSSSTTTKEINLGSNLKPYDKGSFKVTVNLNDTDSDAYFKMKINKINLPKGFKFLAQDDNISPFSTYSKYFKSNESKTDTVTVYWYWDGNISDENDNSFIGKSISANIVINSKQTNPAYMKNGSDFKSEFWETTYRYSIKTITFSNDLSNLPSTCNEENLCWDISASPTQKNKVYGYLVNTGLKDENDKPFNNLFIVSNARIYAPVNSSGLFYNFTKLVKINFNDNFNTENVTNMSSMFSECSSLTSLDLSNFNTASVNTMYEMFNSCSSLTSLDLSSFNTAKVTVMYDMFLLCSSLTSLDLSSFNTANVTNMYRMFYNCSSLTSLVLSSFNTTNVTDISVMFYKCSSLTNLDLSNFNTTKVTTMGSMFYGCSSLTSLDLSSFNTTNVTDIRGMFYKCSSLTSLVLSSFNTTNVTDISAMFYKCSSLTTTINIMSTSVTDYSTMFLGAATVSGAKITVNYTSSTSTLVDNMIATKSSNSNVVKGTQI